MKKVTVWTVVLVLALSGAAMAMGFGNNGAAFGMRAQGQHHQWWDNDKVVKDLSLSSKDVARLDDLFMDHQHRMIDFREDVRKARKDLTEYIESDSFSISGAKDRYKALDKIRSEMGEAMFTYRVMQRELLGTERFESLRDTVRQHRQGRNARRGDSMHNRGDGGNGPGQHMNW